MIDEIKAIKSGKKELREFGLTIGVILLIFGGLAIWRGKATSPYLITAGILFIVFAITLPQALKPLQKAWMAFAVILGVFVSSLILLVLFYAVITPIAIIAKILKNDILDERTDKRKASYWKERSAVAKTKESYENQY